MRRRCRSSAAPADRGWEGEGQGVDRIMSIIVKYVQLADYLTKYTPAKGYLYNLNPLTKLAVVIANIVIGVYLSSPGFSFLSMLGVFAATFTFVAAVWILVHDFVRRKLRLLL